MKTKIVTIVGARPQFVKAAAVSSLLRRRCREILVHTGQHYDHGMSEIFFSELGIPPPDYNLDVGAGSHGSQTGRMIEKIETVLFKEKPDLVVVYGDTNSTLSGALAASKINIPVAHVEAGLRSFKRNMPEEINRVLTDHLSSLLLCPSDTAVKNLMNEGVQQGVHIIGDVMSDVLTLALKNAAPREQRRVRFGVNFGQYLLATVHRAENTDDIHRLTTILNAMNAMNEAVVFPVHPRTAKLIKEIGFVPNAHLKVIPPVGLLDMVSLEEGARMILTDSGGVQKEAYWLGIPCVTLRDETEWIETVAAGWNKLTGANLELILEATRTFVPPDKKPFLYGGDGHVAERCIACLFDSK